MKKKSLKIQNFITLTELIEGSIKHFSFSLLAKYIGFSTNGLTLLSYPYNSTSGLLSFSTISLGKS